MLGFILGRDVLGSPSKSVRFFSVLARSIGDREVKLGQVFRPASLTVAQLFCGREVLQILIVAKDPYQMCSTFEFRSLLLKALNNRKQFFVVNLVVTLRRAYTFREIRN